MSAIMTYKKAIFSRIFVNDCTVFANWTGSTFILLNMYVVSMLAHSQLICTLIYCDILHYVDAN